MKWQDLLDRERDTSLGQALLAADPDDLLEGGREDGRVNVYKAHWVDLELRVIDSDAINWFGHGNCAALAWEIHVLTGLPLLLIEDDATANFSGWAHAGVQMPDGQVLDIFGVRPVEEVIAYWRSYTPGRMTPLVLDPAIPAQRARLNELVGDGPDVEIETMLDTGFSAFERAVVRDFAQVVLDEYAGDLIAAREGRRPAAMV